MRIGIDLNETQEQKAAPKGKYNLQITGCKEKESGPNSKKPGSPMFAVTIGFADEPNVPNITHYISLPETHEDTFKALLLKRFLVLFAIPFGNDLDTEQLAFAMLGATANAEVGHTEPNDAGDVYNTLVVPKIRGE